MAEIIDYFERYALEALEKQVAAMAFLQERMGLMDLDSGLIRFNPGDEFPFQILGTQSDNTLTFQWAWSQEQDQVPDELMKSALRMRQWALANDVAALGEPEIDVDKADGRLLSLLATEICEASCYYREAYEGGALFVLLFDLPAGSNRPFTLRSFSRSLLDMVEVYRFNHRNAVMFYLNHKNIVHIQEGPTIAWRFESGEEMVLTFTQAGTLASMNHEPVS